MNAADQPLPLPGLVSPGPHSDIPQEARIFVPFIGGWDLIITWRQAGAVVRVERGEWHFAWVLEGRGVQDVWITPPRSERSMRADLYEYGSSIRFYDRAIDGWRSTWIGPMQSVVRTFVARRVGDEHIRHDPADLLIGQRGLFRFVVTGKKQGGQ